MRADRAHQDGVAVGRLARDVIRADGAAGTRAVFDDDVGAQVLAQAFRQLAGDQVGRTARRERHHHADDLVAGPGGHGRPSG